MPCLPLPSSLLRGLSPNRERVSKSQNAVSGEKVLSVPIVNYLLLLKSMQYENMGAQEYLDREHRWNVILFLDNGRWIDTRIIINDWIVRLNNAEL